MQNDRAVGGSAHPGVGDANHIFHAALEKFRGELHVSDFGHAGIAFRTRILEHQHAVFINVEMRIIDALLIVLDRFEHDRAATMIHELGRCC